ncbi:MAG: hypothetical protein NVS4B10_22170 [Myxococcales bacterium]
MAALQPADHRVPLANAEPGFAVVIEAEDASDLALHLPDRVRLDAIKLSVNSAGFVLAQDDAGVLL